jgi:hypothetical protein
MLENLTVDDFQPYLHQNFAVRLEDGTDYTLELTGVEDLGPAPLSGGRRPFSLLFHNSQSSRYLPQRIYPLRHPALGVVEVFMTPLGPDSSGMRYQVIFS